MEEFLKDQYNNTQKKQQPAQQQKQAERPAESVEADIKIHMPDRTLLTIKISKKQRYAKIYEALVKKLGLSDFSATFFAIFEIMDKGFTRKLESNEFPYTLFNKKYQESGTSCLVLQKWVFSIEKEIEMYEDSVAVSLLYHLAVEDIRQGRVKPGDKIQQVKELKASNNKVKFLEVVRTLEGYCQIIFPHCQCDARRDGHVILAISLRHLALKACSTDGVLENIDHTFEWNEIKSWDADDEGMCFWFEYHKAGKKPKQVKVFSPHYKYMTSCTKRIQKELEWCKKDEEGNPVLFKEEDKRSHAKKPAKAPSAAVLPISQIEDDNDDDGL
eukprot:TCONS_00047490-protein